MNHQITQLRIQRWQEDVMSLSKQITDAQSLYKEACETRLDRKHRLEELQFRLKSLCDKGPFGIEDHQPRLFDDLPEDSQESIRKVKVPKKIYGILEQSKIFLLRDLVRIADGLDPNYPEGLGSIEGLDIDSKNRLLAELQDMHNPTVTPPTMAVTIPFVKTDSKAVKTPRLPSATEQTTSIEILCDIPSLNLSAGAILQALVMSTGQALCCQDSQESFLLEQDQFELCSI
jgi:hypothetical protein